jgi:glycerophosphoryl diester phosphodiesterase
VADLDLAELARVDVGGGQAIPLLGDVLSWARGLELRVNVELKRDVPSRKKVVRETARVLSTVGAAARAVIVSSFDPWMLAYLGWLSPAVLRGYLFGADRRLTRSGWPAILLAADAVHPERTLVSADRYRAWRNRGNLINVWTVNDATEARALSAIGVDSMVTDTPRAIVDAVR